MLACELQLFQIKKFLALAQGRLAQRRNKIVKPDFAHRHQARVIAMAQQLRFEQRQIAVTSLRPWFTDPARFPAAWIAAVETALAQACQLAGPVAAAHH